MNARVRRLYPLKVMFIADQLHRNGGAERSTYLLAKGLRERGHKVIVCCFSAGEFARDMRRHGFRVEEFRLRSLFSLEALKTLLGLVKLVKRERVSVIVSYHESSDFVGLLTALFARVPIVSSRRDMGYRLESRHVTLYRVINRFFDRITAVSSAVKNKIARTQWCKHPH